MPRGQGRWQASSYLPVTEKTKRPSRLVMKEAEMTEEGASDRAPFWWGDQL